MMGDGARRVAAFAGWRTYLPRWLLFGVLAGIGQPVLSDFDHYWLQKMAQILGAMPFAIACFLAFTPLQNLMNGARLRWRTWCIALGVWLGMKLIFFSAMYAAGMPLPR